MEKLGKPVRTDPYHSPDLPDTFPSLPIGFLEAKKGKTSPHLQQMAGCTPQPLMTHPDMGKLNRSGGTGPDHSLSLPDTSPTSPEGLGHVKNVKTPNCTEKSDIHAKYIHPHARNNGDLEDMSFTNEKVPLESLFTFLMRRDNGEQRNEMPELNEMTSSMTSEPDSPPTLIIKFFIVGGDSNANQEVPEHPGQAMEGSSDVQDNGQPQKGKNANFTCLNNSCMDNDLPFTKNNANPNQDTSRSGEQCPTASPNQGNNGNEPITKNARQWDSELRSELPNRGNNEFLNKTVQDEPRNPGLEYIGSMTHLHRNIQEILKNLKLTYERMSQCDQKIQLRIREHTFSQSLDEINRVSDAYFYQKM